MGANDLYACVENVRTEADVQRAFDGLCSEARGDRFAERYGDSDDDGSDYEDHDPYSGDFDAFNGISIVNTYATPFESEQAARDHIGRSAEKWGPALAVFARVPLAPSSKAPVPRPSAVLPAPAPVPVPASMPAPAPSEATLEEIATAASLAAVASATATMLWTSGARTLVCLNANEILVAKSQHLRSVLKRRRPESSVSDAPPALKAMRTASVTAAAAVAISVAEPAFKIVCVIGGIAPS